MKQRAPLRPVFFAGLSPRRERHHHTAAIIDRTMLHSNGRAWAHFGPQVLIRALACTKRSAFPVIRVTSRCDFARERNPRPWPSFRQVSGGALSQATFHSNSGLPFGLGQWKARIEPSVTGPGPGPDPSAGQETARPTAGGSWLHSCPGAGCPALRTLAITMNLPGTSNPTWAICCSYCASFKSISVAHASARCEQSWRYRGRSCCQWSNAGDQRPGVDRLRSPARSPSRRTILGIHLFTAISSYTWTLVL